MFLKKVKKSSSNDACIKDGSQAQKKGFFKTAVFFSFALLLMAACSTREVNANPGDVALQARKDTPWHIIGDEVSYDEKNTQYILRGNITISKEGLRFSADFARFDQKAMKAFAEGHVVLTTEGDILTGSRLEMDLDTETGTIYDGALFFKENHFYIKGKKIEKTGNQSYSAEQVTVTSCDGDTPAWKITGRKLKVTIEGYGFVRDAAFFAKKAPLFYSPLIVFPAKTKRQTGLLTPQISFSDRKGPSYDQPFFWAINQSSDTTVYAHHMEKRGEKIGIEYRYVLSDSSKGAVMGDGLDDHQTDDSQLDLNRDWGYDDGVNDFSRPNRDRYWFRMKHDQAMPFNFSGKVDLDIVSDQDYLREFKDGYSGFSSTDAYFTKNFGRGMDEYDDNLRLNRLNLSRSWLRYNVNTELRWYDNAISRRWEETDAGLTLTQQQLAMDTTLQQLPIIRFNSSMQKISRTPLFIDFDSEYTYFYREEGTESLIPRCHRMDIHPTIYLPYKFKNYLSVRPFIGLRETFWDIDEFEETPSEMDKKQNRDLYDLNMDLYTEFFKVFHFNTADEFSIKHAVKPRILYSYIPDKDPAAYPQFDGIDRIEAKNLFTFSITNTFISKSKTAREKEAYVYRQFCRFKVQQPYDVNEANEDEPANWRNKVTKEPFYPLYMELEVSPSNFFSVREDIKWSHYEEEFLSHNFRVSLADKREDRVFVEYRYARDPLESIHASEGIAPLESYISSESVNLTLNLYLTAALFVYADYERDLHEAEEIRKGLGFLYKAQCWSFDVYYKNEYDEHKFAFMVNLYGLGEIGGN